MGFWCQINRFRRKVLHVLTKTWRYFLYVTKENDCDWDDHYLISLIAWKCKHMADYHRKYGITENAFRVAKQLEYVVYLVDRYTNTVDYGGIIEKYHQKWGHPEHIHEDWAGLGRSTRITYKSEEAKQAWLVASKESQEAEEKLRQRIWKHINKYHRRWWD